MSHRPSSHRPKSYRISSEQKLFLLVLLSAVPVILLLITVFNNTQMSLVSKLLLIGFCALWLVLVAASVKEKFVYHLRTISNLVEAIRTEDYSLRSSRVREPGELAELYQQINALTSQLKELKQDEFELSHLLERIVNQIDVAIVACDVDSKIRLANRLAAKLLMSDEQQLIGQTLEQVGLQALMSDQGSSLIDHDFPGASGRWQIIAQSYRYRGKPGKIVFITDLKQVLNEEEINAWQRLIRVIAHEVNNSLTPISSICQTLESQLSKPIEQRNEENIKQGLGVIEGRAKDLRDFISVYARIAKLPEPQKMYFSVLDLLNKLQRIFSDYGVDLNDGGANRSVVIDVNNADFKLFGDPVHMEQVLINLIKNALEASTEHSEPVQVSVKKTIGLVEFTVIDSGNGISNPANLFVPFFTTKEKGAGIGLTLCRQIAAKHGGQLFLENRQGQRGAVATLQIPIIGE